MPKLLAPDTRHESKKKFLHESSQTGTEEIHFKTPRRSPYRKTRNGTNAESRIKRDLDSNRRIDDVSN
ncbi:hypothetical protein PPTG_23784 [Phytophthora nicotianae INRA-310]|uniref:Uncharacterized protein n=1 Tax=Phytophthora nicotianae (strain INRA-310) TaxID=761204 RepID=W2PTX8_PHYN3|nr:hypothetical protein PPTG_23784 [Phytophthora nicotianae INRA-310]ETN03475.1 hypothetical protein PPTG_23784 [Phytophthora nicotianae INRA-310]